MSTMFKVGDVIRNAWRIESIKQGGMGVIYLCSLFNQHKLWIDSQGIEEHKEDGNPIVFAIKSFHEELFWHPMVKERFQRESILWTSLPPHPNIVRAITLDQLGRIQFLILEYIDGGDLRSHMSSGNLQLHNVLNLSLQFCHGMEFIFNHSKIIHRDIKPENILLTRDNIVKITDFGLSKASVVLEKVERESNVEQKEGTESQSLTMHGMILGTIPYMSPEQFKDPALVGVASDIYSFGVVLYEMLTGNLPFRGMTIRDYREKHLHQLPISPSKIADIPISISDITTKCLAKNPKDRFSNFNDLRFALEQYCKANGFEHLIPIPVTIEEIEAKITAEEWGARGYSYGRLGRLEQSLSCYLKSLEMNPDGMGHHANVGTALIRLERHSEALSYFEKEVEKHPEESFCYLTLASGYTRVGRWDDAINTIEDGLKLNPNAIHIWRELILVSWGSKRIKKYQEAFSHYVKLLENDTSLTPLEFDNEIVLFEQAGDIEAALHLCEKAVQRFPNATKCWFNFAVILHKIGRLEQALSCYNRVLELDSSMIHALFYRGLLYASCHNFDAAIHDLTKVVQIDKYHAASPVANEFIHLIRIWPEAVKIFTGMVELKTI